MSARKFGAYQWYARRRSDRPSHMWISRFERVVNRRDRKRGMGFDCIIVDESADTSLDFAGVLTLRGKDEI